MDRRIDVLDQSLQDVYDISKSADCSTRNAFLLNIHFFKPRQETKCYALRKGKIQSHAPNWYRTASYKTYDFQRVQGLSSTIMVFHTKLKRFLQLPPFLVQRDPPHNNFQATEKDADGTIAKYDIVYMFDLVNELDEPLDPRSAANNNIESQPKHISRTNKGKHIVKPVKRALFSLKDSGIARMKKTRCLQPQPSLLA
ncbi:hypothetical protein Fot_19370 [Forsythia ovata]|uniref:Uncharacterized protein n=1 Tax=Forsythia ovata TaxID=205694 RepID=A0ABD1VKV3_9LAMI